MDEATEAEGPDGTVPVRGRRRGKAWTRITHGVHRSTVPEARVSPFAPVVSEADLAGWQLLMTDVGCFTGLTALGLRGVELPPLPGECPVFIALQRDDPRPLRRGVHTSRHVRPVPHEVIRGLRVATGAEALLAAGRWLAQLDLVCVIDNALQQGCVELDELAEMARSRRPGAAGLRAALPLVDGAAESVFESLLRLLHVTCGVAVESQWSVRDQTGEEVARADLRVVSTNSLHEYDGADHDDEPRRVKDRRRDRRIDRAGYVRRGYTAGDVLHRAVTVLEDADRALGRVHDPSRIRLWNELVKESMFTSAGRRAFLRRTDPRSTVAADDARRTLGPVFSRHPRSRSRDDRSGGGE